MNKPVEKTAIWDALGTTDPTHTKSFKRAGGFQGTAIKPMWAYRRMTEHFGPCGIGWGIDQPEFDVQDCGDIRLVYCSVSVWYCVDGYPDPGRVFGVGGDTVQGQNKYGATYDDEAYKKAFTDAITNALKMIGVGADVHMGMFDDSKYVNDAKAQFSKKSSAALKREDVWPAFEASVYSCGNLGELEQCKDEWREKVKEDKWPRAWIDAMPDVFSGHEKFLMDELEKQEAA